MPESLWQSIRDFLLRTGSQVSSRWRALQRLGDTVLSAAVTPAGLEYVFGRIDREKALRILDSAYDRVESLHQALCIAAFVGGGAMMAKLFPPITESAKNGVSAGASVFWWYVVGSVVLFSLGLLLRRAVVLAVRDRLTASRDIIDASGNYLL